MKENRQSEPEVIHQIPTVQLYAEMLALVYHKSLYNSRTNGYQEVIPDSKFPTDHRLLSSM